jgi:hypothetical protein
MLCDVPLRQMTVHEVSPTLQQSWHTFPVEGVVVVVVVAELVVVEVVVVVV